MKVLQPKLRLLFVPFLLISACFLALGSLLYWFIFIQWGFSSLKEDIVQFWLPFALPWIPVWIWLRPRIKLLTFKKDTGAFLYQFLAAMAIAVPLMVAEAYITTATGKLTILQRPQEFQHKPLTKYYNLSHCYIDKRGVGVHYAAKASGKYNQDLNLHLFVALPIYASAADTVAGEAFLWLGKRYAKTISNRLSEAEKQSRFKAFADDCQQEFDRTNFQRFQFLERLGNTNDHDQLQKAVGKSRVAAYSNPVVLVAHDEPFDQRNGSKLKWVFLSFAIGAVVWFLLLLIPQLNTTTVETEQSGEQTKRSDLKETFSFFLPRKGFVVTPLLMDLNILIYLIMMLAGLGLVSFGGEDLLRWGANFRPYTTSGEWWRLLTSVFLHGGIMHLAANMTGLLFAGLFLEPLLGTKRYVLLYLLTGVLASCASLWWHPATVSVGASGAIFGLYGCFLSLLLCGVFPKEVSKPFLLSTLFFVGYNLLMGLAGGIDNAAHIGGLVSGLIIGFSLVPFLKRSVQEQPKPIGLGGWTVKKKSEEYNVNQEG